jgi:hypothetical protein
MLFQRAAQSALAFGLSRLGAMMRRPQNLKSTLAKASFLYDVGLEFKDLIGFHETRQDEEHGLSHGKVSESMEPMLRPPQAIPPLSMFDSMRHSKVFASVQKSESTRTSCTALFWVVIENRSGERNDQGPPAPSLLRFSNRSCGLVPVLKTREAEKLSGATSRQAP